MSENLELFRPEKPKRKLSRSAPLAERLRPLTWNDFIGIECFDPGLISQIQSGKGRAPSLVLWGPPGCGKTTFARLMGESFDCHFAEFSAVLGGVKEVRQIIAQARKLNVPTILFVDEIHRFSKSQQDAFLPHIEDGTIVLVGATTANPSFYLNGALLSRLHVLCFEEMSETGLLRCVERAEVELQVELASELKERVVKVAGGDVRRTLNLLEGMVESRSEQKTFQLEDLEGYLAQGNVPFYDRDGEEHYNMASAFIKSMRGSDPDAALYWGMRMLEGGEDPAFLLRRMMIFASEDIGNADPRALSLAVSATESFERIGMPEGRIPIAHCISYLASAPKSNRAYSAMHKVLAAIRERPKVAVPKHLRNAPTKLMKSIGYGEGYDYPHGHDEGFVADEQYLPDEEHGKRFYEPSEHGFEIKIKERLSRLRGKSVD